MRRIIRRALCLLLCLAMLPCAALGERAYLIPDSNSRLLTREELWGWDYESLGYILNEIFARHGYNFIPGEVYDVYFRTKPWYVPNEDSDNQRACYPKLNSVEWKNEHLVKEVRQEMRSRGTTNDKGKSVWDYQHTIVSLLPGFRYIEVKAGQKWKVYSAPDHGAWRAAKGKALLSTNGIVYAAGWENGWLMVMYELNAGAMRVGYVSRSDMKKAPGETRQLAFAYKPASVVSRASLTDDPVWARATVRILQPGETVTYLATYQDETPWAYVETTMDGKLTRGYVPLECISIP